MVVESFGSFGALGKRVAGRQIRMRALGLQAGGPSWAYDTP